jgi:hypothetical protein
VGCLEADGLRVKICERAYLASTTRLESGILWSAPAERSGDGALAVARHWPN